MRDTTQLHPLLQVKIYQLVELCKKNNLKIGISECLRTVKEQDALYAQGRTTSGSIVTNAKGSTYSSMHQWGVAFDFYRNDGKGAYNDSDNFFSNVGKLGQSIGLEWGGSWKSITDKPHFQLPNWGSTTSTLKSKYGTPEKFMASWIKFEPREYTTTKEMFLYKSDKASSTNRLPWNECNIKDKCTNVDGFAKLNKGVKITITEVTYKDSGKVLGKLKKSPYPWCCLYNEGYQIK